MAMVRVRNVSDGPVVVGEKYLNPGESRLLDSGWAALILAQNPDRLTGSAVLDAGLSLTSELLRLSTPTKESAKAMKSLGIGEEAFWDGEEPPRPGEEAFWDGEDPPHPGDGVLNAGPSVIKDNLRAIHGIGARIAEALTILGVNSYTDLAGADAVWLAAALDGSSQAQVERWQAQARRLLERLDE